ncbi:MAG: hypothetical protein BWX72_02123 [Firmicutes bacterium ADurb.Bin080]|nr:MAG: hypothetical protein BWX72_02123 [Firmicutes bacterium ADurb.Bin080]
MYGGAVGFLTGGIHFNSNVKSGELQKTFSQSNNIDDEANKIVEMLRATVANDSFSEQNRVSNTISNRSFGEQNNINIEVQLETLPQRFFDDIDGEITKAIENEDSETIEEIYNELHQKAVDESDDDCENALINVSFEHEATAGWLLTFLECIAEKQSDCLYIILALSSDGKTRRYLVAMRTSSGTNQFGYGKGELCEVNPDNSSITHGETSTNFFDITDSMEKALAKYNPKAKKISAVASATLKKKKSSKTKEDIDDLMKSLFKDDNYDKRVEEFSVSEEDAEIIATLFRQGTNDVNTILTKLKWEREKRNQFIDFIFTMGFIEIGDFDSFEDEIFDNVSFSIDYSKFQEFFDNLPIDFGDDFFDDEWHKECCESIINLIDEITATNKNKLIYDSKDIDLLIGKCFCCITRKPTDLCAAVQDEVKNLAKNKKLSIGEIKTLIKNVFLSFAVDEDDESEYEEEVESYDTDTMIGLMGMPMNENIFAKHQEVHPYFDASILMGKVKPLDLSNLNGTNQSQLSWQESCMLIFGNIFGGYGIDKDLNKAYDMTIGFFDWAKAQMPTPNIKNEKYVSWLKQWGDMNILMGTIYSYQGEYIKAAYHFIIGLKTEMVNINMPYCDFIRYILKKLDTMPKEKVIYTGCGFSKDSPMGSLKGRMLIANKAIEIIPEMEGLNGEAIIAKGGRNGFYGYLVRKGSTSCTTGMVDIYETYIIDSQYNLMKAEMYFNGYFDSSVGGSVKIAKGFRIKPNSLMLNDYNFC